MVAKPSRLGFFLTARGRIDCPRPVRLRNNERAGCRGRRGVHWRWTDQNNALGGDAARGRDQVRAGRGIALRGRPSDQSRL